MAKRNVQTLKGFRDLLPEEALKRKWLREKIEKVFELWGYDPVETPTLEPLELFEGNVGEEEKLFYKFEDPGGRKVALRFDQTVPICRLVGQYKQELSTPFKRYQIQLAFRAEKPQKGRYREFLQADADIFGVESPLADAEVIALSLDIFKQLGFEKAKLLLNDRKLFKDYPYEALVAIDKLKKIGEGRVITEMVAKGIPKSKATKYLSSIKNLKPNKAIETILAYLEKSGFNKDWYAFDPTVTRSFSYSTGPIWEVEIPGFTSGSVLGGERFDKLTEKVSGVKVPATGFGLGFDRTLEAAEQFKLIPKRLTTSKALITIFSPKQLDTSIQISDMLRKAGINCELYPDETANIKKQLKYADKKGVPWAVIIGPEEILKGQVVLKDMNNKKQETIPTQSLLTRIK